MKKAQTILSWAPLALTIPPKYLRPKRGNLLFFIISFATVFSAFVCTVVALAALAATNGADLELGEKLAGIDSHVIIFSSEKDQVYISDHGEIIIRLNEISDIRAVSPFLVCDVQLQIAINNIEPYPVQLKGIIAEKEMDATNLVNCIEKGDILPFWDESSTHIPLLIGSGISRDMNITIDDTLTIIKPESFEIKKFPARVSGIFKTGIGYDYNLVYAPLRQVQLMIGVDNKTITGLGIKGDNLLEADSLASKIRKTLGKSYDIKDWKSINSHILGGIRLLQRVSLILLFGIYLLVLVCLSCILLLVLHEKRRDIAILLTLGMRPLQVQRTFVFLGMLIGIVGILVGYITTPLLCEFLNYYKIIKLPPEALIIDHVPFILEWQHFFWVGISELVLLILVGYLTTLNVYKVKPVVILRDE